MPRRNRIPFEHRERIVRAFEDVKRDEARRQGIALGNYRTRLLQQALQQNIGTITAAKCGQWFRFMQTYLPRCLNSEATEG